MSIIELIQFIIGIKGEKEDTETRAREFINSHKDEINLLPLCDVAWLYNGKYSRRLYSDFLCLPERVRDKVLKLERVRVKKVKTKDFFNDCLKKLKIAMSFYMPKDRFNDLYYDGAKYLVRAIERYGASPVDNNSNDVELNRILSIPFFRPTEYTNSVIQYAKLLYDFESCSEKDACVFVCLVAQHIADNSGMMIGKDSGYENAAYSRLIDCISGGDEKVEVTAEDMFLYTLFEIKENIWNIEKGKIGYSTNRVDALRKEGADDCI